jgi:hypothetical protein
MVAFEGARQVAELYCHGLLFGIGKAGFIPCGFGVAIDGLPMKVFQQRMDQASRLADLAIH